MNDNMIYSTSDLHLAVVLTAKGFDLIDIITSPDRRRAIFRFADNPERESIIRDYFSSLCVVDARTLFDLLRSLKSRAREALEL